MSEELYSIHVPTMGGMLWITHVGLPQLDVAHHKGLVRPIAATNMERDAGAWDRHTAESYLAEARKMWIMATMGRAE